MSQEYEPPSNLGTASFKLSGAESGRYRRATG